MQQAKRTEHVGQNLTRAQKKLGIYLRSMLAGRSVSVILEDTALPNTSKAIGFLQSYDQSLKPLFSLNKDFTASLDKPRCALTDLRQILVTRSSVGNRGSDFR